MEYVYDKRANVLLVRNSLNFIKVIGKPEWEDQHEPSEGIDFEKVCTHKLMGRCFGVLCECEGEYLAKPL